MEIQGLGSGHCDGVLGDEEFVSDFIETVTGASKLDIPLYPVSYTHLTLPTNREV